MHDITSWVSFSALTAIVRTFDEHDYTFRFHDGRQLVLTLEDILYITGLPIDGNPVSGVEVGNINVVAYCTRYFGQVRVPTPSDIDGNRVHMSWLKSTFESVPDDVNHENVEEIWPFVQAYILYIYHCIIDSDPSKTFCSLRLLPLISSVEEINSYAWGSALLTSLMDSIKDVKALKKKSLTGFPLVLLIFFMIRFPPLTTHLSCGRLSLVDRLPTAKFPLLVDLLPDLVGVFHNPARVSDTDVDDIMDILQGVHHTSRPYSVLSNEFLPVDLRPQLALRSSLTCLLCFQKISHHRSDLAKEQFEGKFIYEPYWALPSLRGTLQLNGKQTCDWRTRKGYESYSECWTSRWERLILLVQENALAPVDPVLPCADPVVPDAPPGFPVTPLVAADADTEDELIPFM